MSNEKPSNQNVVQPKQEIHEPQHYSNPQVNYHNYQLPNYVNYPQYTYGQQTNYVEQSYLNQPLKFPTFKKPTLVEPFDQSMLNDEPCNVQCPNCHAKIMTRVEKTTGWGTCVGIGGVCLMGFFLPFLCCGCQFIPCCVKDFLDTEHYCKNCDSHLGTNRAL